MNKEQFKNSIVNLINYYTQNAVQYNLNARDAQEQGMENMIDMIQNQMSALNYGFEQGLDKLLNEVFPEEENIEEEFVEE